MPSMMISLSAHTGFIQIYYIVGNIGGSIVAIGAGGGLKHHICADK